MSMPKPLCISSAKSGDQMCVLNVSVVFWGPFYSHFVKFVSKAKYVDWVVFIVISQILL